MPPRLSLPVSLLCVVVPRLHLVCSMYIMLVEVWAICSIITLFRDSVTLRTPTIISRRSLFVLRRLGVPYRRWWMSYRRRRPSRFLGCLRVRTLCYLSCPRSLTSHRASASLHHSVDRFSLGYLRLVPSTRHIFSGPTIPASSLCFFQLAVCLG